MLNGIVIATCSFNLPKNDLLIKLLILSNDSIKSGQPFVIVKVHGPIIVSIGQMIQLDQYKIYPEHVSCISKDITIINCEKEEPYIIKDDGSLPILFEQSEDVDRERVVKDEGDDWSTMMIDMATVVKGEKVYESSSPLLTMPTLINYRGVITKRFDGNKFELDGGREILLPTKVIIGEEYLFYNLKFKGEMLLYCPVYSSGLPTSDGGGDHIIDWSLKDSIAWRGHHQLLTRSLSGILSSSYFTNFSKYNRLGQKLINSLRPRKMISTTLAFIDHSTKGNCYYCTGQSIPTKFIPISDICQGKYAEEEEEEEGGGGLVQLIEDYLIGWLQVCEKTGRVALNDSTGRIYILYYPPRGEEGRIVESLNSLVILSNFLLYTETFQKDTKVRYIITKMIVQVAPLCKVKVPPKDPNPSSTVESLLLMEMLLVKRLGPPTLFNTSKVMMTTIDSCKFGRIIVKGGGGGTGGTNERIEMTNQQPFTFLVPTALIVRLGIVVEPGSILCYDSNSESNGGGKGDDDYQRRMPTMLRMLKFVLDDCLEGKEIKIQELTLSSIKISCSKVANEYLQQSQNLLKDTSLSLLLPLNWGRMEKETMVIAQIEGTVIKREFQKGIELGLPSHKNPPNNHYLFSHYYIGLPPPPGDDESYYLSCDIQLTNQRVRLIVSPNVNFSLPLELIPGAIVKASNLRVTKVITGPTILLSTTKTQFSLIGMDLPSSSSSLSFPSPLNQDIMFPLCFLSEVKNSKVSNSQFSIIGRFLKIRFLKIKVNCVQCGLVLQGGKCLKHGDKSMVDKAKLDFKASFLLSDGTEQVDVLMESFPEFLKVTNNFDRERLWSMIMKEAPFDYYNSKEERKSMVINPITSISPDTPLIQILNDTICLEVQEYRFFCRILTGKRGMEYNNTNTNNDDGGGVGGSMGKRKFHPGTTIKRQSPPPRQRQGGQQLIIDHVEILDHVKESRKLLFVLENSFFTTSKN